MSIRDYFTRLKSVIELCEFVYSYDLKFDERSNDVGYIKGTLNFPQGFELHFREYVDAAKGEKYKYAYHAMKNTMMIFRYDNASDIQARALESFPHHKHLADETVIEAEVKTLQEVLAEIEALLSFSA